jgi:hypothetical protein
MMRISEKSPPPITLPARAVASGGSSFGKESRQQATAISAAALDAL